MKLILLTLFLSINVLSCYASEREEVPHAPLLRGITPRDCIVSERVVLLPMNGPLMKDLLRAYMNPRNMTDKDGEYVSNPFDDSCFCCTAQTRFIWGMVSHDGPFGHVSVDVRDIRAHVETCNIIFSVTEIAKRTPLVIMALQSLFESKVVKCDQWSTGVYHGNMEQRAFLESLGFSVENYGVTVSYVKKILSENRGDKIKRESLTDLIAKLMTPSRAAHQ